MLPEPVEDLLAIAPAVRAGERYVIVSQSEDYPGELLFSASTDHDRFVRDHLAYLSPYCLLSELFMLGSFVDLLESEGWHVVALPDAVPIVERYRDWSRPLDVAGLRLPQGLYTFQQFALRRAIEVCGQGRSRRRGFFYNFGTGCIQGDAEITVNRGGNGVRRRLSDVVRRFNGEDGRYKWDPTIPTYVQREVNGIVRLARLRHAWCSGVKTTYTVTTDSGRTLRATDEHPFLTERGWLRLDELKVDDELHVIGEQSRGLPRQPKPSYKQIGGLRHHPHAVNPKARVPFHRLVAEASLNGMTVEEFILHVRLAEVIGLQFLDPAVWAVHHRDHDWRNCAPENLEVLTHTEHHRRHAEEGKADNVLYKIVTEQVVSVVEYGPEETYDLEVEGDPHNFLANGIVVHNTGKSVVAAAGMQELLVNRREIDLCLCFTLKRNRINMARQVEALTDLGAVVVEGAKDRRQRLYGNIEEPCCLLLNYEKAHHDHEELAELVRGKRVLFVFDEVQKIVRGENAPNRARKGMDALMRTCRIAMAWAMSASVVKSSPLRYHDTYELLGPNPLGTRKAFVARYCDEVVEYQLRPGVMLKNYRWNPGKLAEVRHIVSVRTQAVRKTDPGVREYFKGMTTQVVRVQRSPEEERLREKIMEDASRFVGQINYTFSQHYNCLRYLCNTPAALAFSVSEVADRVFHANPALVGAPSTKFEMIADKIEDIRDQGDQVVVFTQWTYLTLFLFAKELADRGIRYVTHWGGQSSADAQQAQDSFKSNPEITVFLSSDAGAFGLNFQNARFVISIECPYDPDVLMQRNDRIDRADSYLDGLTSYIYIVEDSVEERVWAINEERRRISSAVQGTAETLSRFSAEELAMTEAQAMRNLIFGNSLTPR